VAVAYLSELLRYLYLRRSLIRRRDRDGLRALKTTRSAATSIKELVKVEIPEKLRISMRRPHGVQQANTGSIVGKVIDPSGAAIAGATVHARRSGETVAAVLEYKTQCGPDGLYLLDGYWLASTTSVSSRRDFRHFG